MSPTAPDALQLRDIHLPPAPPFWPPAPGWWLLAVLAVVAIGLLAWGIAALLRRRRIRQQGSQLLDALARLGERLERDPSPEGLAHVSVLLRRLALSKFPRQQVAALTGTAWLHFLDESGGQGRFVNGPGAVLASGPYQRSLPPDFDRAGFIALLRDWVEQNQHIGRAA